MTSAQPLRSLLQAPAQRPFAVLGMGTSGRAMAAFLARRGAQVLGLDDRPLQAQAHPELRALGVTLCGGPLPADAASGCVGVAVSPGIDTRRHPVAQAAKAAGVPLFGELALAGTLPCPAVCITGTNGKSTTTVLCGALLAGQGLRTFVGGNLGDPIVAWLDTQAKTDVAVLELSSYQLETVADFAPQVAVLLNVTPDHLERYTDFADYVATKARLVRAVPASGTVILNADDPHLLPLQQLARGQVVWFSRGGLPASLQRSCVPRLQLQGDRMQWVGASETLARFGTVSLQHPRLLGQHNADNALAAFLAVQALGRGYTAADLSPSYQQFTGLPHRLQWVGSLRGVDYIDDSKATNDASAAIGVQAMKKPCVLLLGGQDKGAGYAAVRAAALGVQPNESEAQGVQAHCVRAIVAFGAAQELIAQAFAGSGLQVHCRPTLQEACAAAATLARVGDAVLLSPACSSFDQFTNYGARGAAFVQWLQAQSGASSTEQGVGGASHADS
jgi:UDP-N-acetylmuramoylalanine--D-glutamate ligase